LDTFGFVGMVNFTVYIGGVGGGNLKPAIQKTILVSIGFPLLP
jgi:hypothetical protein